jgi:gliding motility-associated-like protein
LGLEDGKDTACIEVCDIMGACQTVMTCVLVVPDRLFRDTVFLGIDVEQYCFDGTLITGNIVELVDNCPDSHGSDVSFSQAGNCIEYYGLQEGVDTVCYKVVDDQGNIGFARLIVTVQKNTAQTLCDSVFVLGSGSVCLDTTELQGNIVQVYEACEGSGTGHVIFTLDVDSRCVFFDGLSLGVDSTCVVLCDDLGICDTAYLCISVVPFLSPPSLGDDQAETEKATPVVIDFAANDTIYGTGDTLFILDEPISGQAIWNLDNSFTYIPDDPFCDRTDEFTYVVCTPNGCDTATVSVFIKCIELTVFNAVSPNNDGQNDFFHIAKIEDFPENRLWIYNRWGQLVFDQTAYKNFTWPLSWGDDTDLPDGTYYYVLEWEDNGEKTVQRGYFELFR